MNVLLLNPPGTRMFLRDQFCSNIAKTNYYWPPIDLLVLSGILKHKFNTFVLDAIVEKKSTYGCLKFIRDNNIQVIITLTGTASWDEDKVFLSEVRTRFPNILVIGSGGVLLHYYRKLLAEMPSITAVILNFTSDKIVNFIDAFHRNRNIAEPFQDIVYRNADGQIIQGTLSANTISYPTPEHHKFKLKLYNVPFAVTHPMTSILTNYGCPFSCHYCIAGMISHRIRDVDEVITEMKAIKQQGIKEVFVRDWLFEAKRKNVVELLEKMIFEKIDLKWSCSSKVDTLDEGLLKRMKTAGCHAVLLGVEGANKELLEKYSRRLNVGKTREIFSICKRYKIKTIAHYILGLPGETRTTALETIRFAIELDSTIASFNIAVPQVGTELRKRMVADGLIESDENAFHMDVSQTYPQYDTDTLTKRELWQLRNLAIKKFYLRRKYIVNRLLELRTVYEFKTEIKAGFNLVRNLIVSKLYKSPNDESKVQT